jgi:hypothetical protein
MNALFSMFHRNSTFPIPMEIDSVSSTGTANSNSQNNNLLHGIYWMLLEPSNDNNWSMPPNVEELCNYNNDCAMPDAMTTVQCQMQRNFLTSMKSDQCQMRRNLLTTMILSLPWSQWRSASLPRLKGDDGDHLPSPRHDGEQLPSPHHDGGQFPSPGHDGDQFFSTGAANNDQHSYSNDS